MQIRYLDQQVSNLVSENSDLKETLVLNKQLIKDLTAMGYEDEPEEVRTQNEQQVEQLKTEIELWQQRAKAVADERDGLQARMLMQEQILENSKSKEDDVGSIYKEEIEELKQNLDQKEYSLQLTEQRAAAFERLLHDIAGKTPEVQ